MPLLTMKSDNTFLYVYIIQTYIIIAKHASIMMYGRYSVYTNNLNSNQSKITIHTERPLG